MRMRQQRFRYRTQLQGIKEVTAATVIQVAYRIWHARQAWTGAVLLQTVARQWNNQRRYRMQRHKTTRIQAVGRCYMARCKYLEVQSHRHCKAIVLQGLIRRRQAYHVHSRLAEDKQQKL